MKLRIIAGTLLFILVMTLLGCNSVFGATNNASQAKAKKTPVVSRLQPGAISAGARPVVLTVMGSNFDGKTVVLWNKTPRTTRLVSATQLQASLSATDVAVPGTAAVAASNTSTGITSNSTTFTIVRDPTITTTSLPAATSGTLYSATLTAIGGTSPYTWSATGLPAGLLANSNGTISGTPTTAGSYNLAVTAVDATSTSASQSLALSVGNPPSQNTVTITTLSLPSGTVGTAYSATLNASGGTTPYTWSVLSGALPAGLSLTSSSGTISGTPSASGTFNVTLGVTDANGASATSNFSIVVATAALLLQVTTTALPGGSIGSLYSASLSATGGTAPYTWTLASGTLPSSVALDATTGVIGGTPTAGGNFDLTVQVTDSAQKTAGKALPLTISNALLDQYGGRMDRTCNPVGNNRWSSAKVNNGWFFCTPAGHAFWMQGVQSVDYSDNVTDYQGVSHSAFLANKYNRGGGKTWGWWWGETQVERLKSWNFNTLGEYVKPQLLPTTGPADAWGDPYLDTKLPYVGKFDTAVGAEWNFDGLAKGWAKGWGTGIKLSLPVLSSMWFSFTDGVDPFDPHFSEWVSAAWKSAKYTGDVSKSNSDYLIGYMIDESDFSAWTRCGTDFQDVRAGVLQGPPPIGNCAVSFGLFALISSPVQAAVNPAGDEIFRASGGNGSVPVYPDVLFHAKVNDSLSSPAAANSGLANWLQQTSDNAPGYATIAALNSAWGSHYTTFGSTATAHTSVTCATADGSVGPFTCTLGTLTPLTLQVFANTTLVAGDTGDGVTPISTSSTSHLRGATIDSASIVNPSTGAVTIKFIAGNAPANGTALTVNYQTGGWGVGTGLLDEDGTCPSKGANPCWMPTNAYAQTGANTQAQMVTDLNNFLYHMAKTYWGIHKAARDANRPGVLLFGPTGMGTTCAPPRAAVLKAAGEMLDVITLNTLPCGVADDQARIDFVAANAGDKPWINWEGFTAQADSYFSPVNSNSSGTEGSLPTTQAGRATLYQQVVNHYWNAQGTNDHVGHVAGFLWWELYDARAEALNLGLATNRDNPYDGVSAMTATGTDVRGYPIGGEKSNYGNFLGPVTTVNGMWQTAPR